MQLQTNSAKTPQEQEEEPTSCFNPQLTTLDAVAQQNYTTYCKDQYGTVYWSNDELLMTVAEYNQTTAFDYECIQVEKVYVID